MDGNAFRRTLVILLTIQAAIERCSLLQLLTYFTVSGLRLIRCYLGRFKRFLSSYRQVLVDVPLQELTLLHSWV